MPNTPQAGYSGDRFDPQAFLGRSGTGKTTEKYLKNQKIFSQGEVANTVFFILKGKVKVTVLSEHGKEAVIGIFATGEFFRAGCLAQGGIRSTTCHDMGDCLITSITKSAML